MGKKHKKHRKIVHACIFSMVFAVVLTIPAASRTNIASRCQIDSFCCAAGEGTCAAMLTDHDPGYETKWETGDGSIHPGEPHWAILDFGAELDFDRLRLIKASQGIGDFGRTEFNADGFAFSVSSDKENWTLLLDIAGDGENDIFEASFPPVAARYLKLTITHPEQESDETGAARLYDFKVFGYSEPPQATQTTEPEEIVEIEPDPVPLADFHPPDTSDSSLILLLLLSALIILRKFIIHH